MLNTVENKGKYYTPTIDEFHVGFEFELLTTLKPGATSMFEEWKKYTVKDITWFEVANRHFEDLFDRKHIRVKYLDKEDIESLGFITDPSGERYFELNDYQLNLNIHPVYNVTIFTDKYGDTRMIFQGTIKNKSELKQVLKMIGVL